VSSILIDHHNRLGDHLMCNGIVREYAKRYDRVGVFTIPKFKAFVEFMFRDLPHVVVISLPTQRDKHLFRIWNLFYTGDAHYDTIKKIYDVDFETGISSEYQFYKIAGVPFEKKWDSFHVERDSEREQALALKLQLPKEYLFVHDDARYPIDDTTITSTLPVFRVDPTLTDNLFDYCGIIEKASEVHVIDSSFMFLIDCLQYTNQSQTLFVHRYARPNAPWNLPILRKSWHILT
jgi:hypothetical protein